MYIAKDDRIIQVDKERAKEFIDKYGFHYVPKSTVRRIKAKLRRKGIDTGLSAIPR